MMERSPGDRASGPGPLKVLMVIHSHTCGGAQTNVVTLMRGLLGRGIHAAYAGPMDSWIGGQVEKHNMPFLHVPLHGNTLDLYSLWKIARMAGKHGFGIIHTHLGRGAYYGGVAGRLCGIPCITTIHGADVYGHLYRGREARIIAVSEAVRFFLVSKGIPAGKIDVVYNGIETEGRDEAKRISMRTELGLGDSETAICMAARFAEVKGHDVLMDALRGVRCEWKLFLAGHAQGEWYEKMRSLVLKRGLEEKVIFLGHRDDISELMNAMDVYTAPSRWEGLGISLIEAMAKGVPVVASAVGGIPELIKNGENGLLVPAGDSAALGRAVERILSDPHLRESVAKAGAEAVCAKFSLDAMLDGTLSAYGKALG